MNNIEQKIIATAKEVTLTQAEKAHIRSRLSSHISKTKKGTTLFPYTQFFASVVYRHSVSFAFVAVLFFTGGLSAMADKALPGTTLFSFKTGVNEKVLSWFALTDQSKRELSITLAERRLLEAETIATKPEISEKVKKAHTELLDKQLSQVESVVEVQNTPIEATTMVSPTVADEVPEPVQTTRMVEAPQVMMMSAPAPAPEFSAKIATFAPEAEAVPVSKEEVSSLRVRIQQLKATLVELRKNPLYQSDAMNYETKLLRSQRSLLMISASEKSDDEKRALFTDAENVISEIEQFILQSTQEKKDTQNIETNKEVLIEDTLNVGEIDGEIKVQN